MPALPFPKSLPDFQRLFPDDAACATYLERLRWPEVFACSKCQWSGEPYRFDARPGVLRCRECQADTCLTVGTIMERTHTPLSVWFWGAYLMTSLTPGMSARQFQRQLGLTRYETAFGIMHKLRSGMVNPERTRIGKDCSHVEVDETWVGGKTHGKGRGVHEQILVIGAVEACRRVTGKAKAVKRGGLYAGRLRLSVVPNRTAKTLTEFVEATVEPGMVVTDGWSGYSALQKKSYDHLAAAENGSREVAEQYLPLIHLVFSNLKAWLTGMHHGVSHKHLQAYLNEFTFRFNRRFYPFNSFRSLLGLSADAESPTYDDIYSGAWKHPNHISGS